jgi:hypothetical protein
MKNLNSTPIGETKVLDRQVAKLNCTVELDDRHDNLYRVDIFYCGDNLKGKYTFVVDLQDKGFLRGSASSIKRAIVVAKKMIKKDFGIYRKLYCKEIPLGDARHDSR